MRRRVEGVGFRLGGPHLATFDVRVGGAVLVERRQRAGLVAGARMSNMHAFPAELRASLHDGGDGGL